MILTYRRINYRIYCVAGRPFQVSSPQTTHWHVIQRYAIPEIMMYHIRIRILIIIWQHRHRPHRKPWALLDPVHKVRAQRKSELWNTLNTFEQIHSPFCVRVRVHWGSIEFRTCSDSTSPGWRRCQSQFKKAEIVSRWYKLKKPHLFASSPGTRTRTQTPPRLVS